MKSGQVISMAHKENNLYILDASPFILEYAYMVITNDINTLIKSADVPIYHALIASTNSTTGTTAIWYHYLGHIMLRSIKRLFQQNMVKGMHITDSDSHDSGIYKAYLEGKQTRAPIPKVFNVQNPSVLHRVYLDLVGPIEPQGRNGEHYFMTFLDGHSHYLKMVLLKSKNEAEEQLKSLIERAEVEIGYRVNFFRSDGGREYSSDLLKKYFKLHGVHHELTNPDTPQENSSAEWVNHTILDIACTMIKESDLPESFWLYVVNYATYILNRIPTYAIEKDIIPYQAYTGNKPFVIHLRVFGCIAHALIPKNKRSKFGSKSLQCTHLGYSPRKKTYILVYCPSGQIFESQDVCFDEGSEVEHTRVVIDPSSSDEPAPEDKNPVPEIKDKKHEERDVLKGNNSTKADSIDLKQVAVDSHNVCTSKESNNAMVNKVNDSQAEHLFAFTSSQSMDCDGQATTPINKPCLDSILSTSKTPRHTITSLTMADESMQSTMSYSPYLPLVSPPEICRLLRNHCAPVQDDDARYQHSAYQQKRMKSAPKLAREKMPNKETF